MLKLLFQAMGWVSHAAAGFRSGITGSPMRLLFDYDAGPAERTQGNTNRSGFAFFFRIGYHTKLLEEEPQSSVSSGSELNLSITYPALCALAAKDGCWGVIFEHIACTLYEKIPLVLSTRNGGSVQEFLSSVPPGDFASHQSCEARRDTSEPL